MLVFFLENSRCSVFELLKVVLISYNPRDEFHPSSEAPPFENQASTLSVLFSFFFVSFTLNLFLFYSRSMQKLLMEYENYLIVPLCSCEVKPAFHLLSEVTRIILVFKFHFHEDLNLSTLHIVFYRNSWNFQSTTILLLKHPLSISNDKSWR